MLSLVKEFLFFHILGVYQKARNQYCLFHCNKLSYPTENNGEKTWNLSFNFILLQY